jgi:hypothetical protein
MERLNILYTRRLRELLSFLVIIINNYMLSFEFDAHHLKYPEEWASAC